MTAAQSIRPGTIAPCGMNCSLCWAYIRTKMVCLRRIRRGGLSVWLREQTERQALLEELLQNYNEGRLMSFYCKACARMPAGLIKKALKSAKAKSAGEAADRPDVKSRAAFMKETIKNLASEKKIDLG